MKKQLFLCLSFLMTTAFTFVNAQTLSVTELGAQVVGTSPTINFNYTSTTTCAVYAELRIANISGGVISQDYSSGSNYIAGKFSASLPAGTSIDATMTFPIAANVSPSSTLPAGKTYSWVYKLTPAVNNYDDAGSTYQWQSTSAIINAPLNPISLSVTALGAQEVGTSPTINFNYTSTTSCAVYAELRIANISGTGVISQDYSSGSNYIAGTFSASLPVATTLTAATMSFPIAANVPPSSTLAAGKTYSWVYKLTPGVNNYNDAGSTYQSQPTSAIINPSSVVSNTVNITSVPTTIAVGSNLNVDYNYTLVNAGRVKIEVLKANSNGSYNSGIVSFTTNPAGPTTNTPVIDSKSLLIPDGTVASASLSNGEYYQVLLSYYDGSGTYLGGTSKNLTITPNVTTIWDGSAWSNGNPDGTLEVVINGDLTTSGNLIAKKLTVNAGKSFTIASGYNVNVTNEVINNGTFVVENNANLVQTNNVTNTGAITVNRASASLKRLDYSIWSSPTGITQKLNEFSPLTSTGRFNVYNPTTDIYNVVSDATPFATGKGYLIRMPNTWDATTPSSWTGSFVGIPNNGTVTVNGLTAAGYNAIGNPYPSSINANAFITTNSIVEALYFWRKTNGVAGTNGTAYATYTTAGGVANGGITPDGTIQVGQGFIIKSPATSVSFTNAMRSSSNTSPFLRVKAAAQKDRVWINLSQDSNPVNQILVAYMDGATIGVDNGIDGKYFNDSATALTSNIDGDEFVIQGRPAFDVSDVVALNFKTENAGTFTIAKDHTDGLFAAGQEVYLTDATTGTQTNLQTDAYTFTAAAGVSNDRFTLKYQKTLGVKAVDFNDNSVKVYSSNGTLTVNSVDQYISSIQVYDIQGRILAEQNNVNANVAVINNLRTSNNVVLVKVTSINKTVVIKKVVN